MNSFPSLPFLRKHLGLGIEEEAIPILLEGAQLCADFGLNSRWHHPSHDEPAGIFPTLGRPRSPTPAPSYPLPGVLAPDTAAALRSQLVPGDWDQAAASTKTTRAPPRRRNRIPDELSPVTQTRLRHRHY